MAASYSLATQRRCAASGGAYVVALVASGGSSSSACLAASLAESGAKGSSLLEVLSSDLRPLRSIRSTHGRAAATDLAFLTGSQSEFLSCGEDGAVRLWDVRVKGAAPQRVLRQPSQEAVVSLAVGDGGKLCACAVGSTISVLDIASGKDLLAHSEAHSEPVGCLRFHPERQHELVTSGDDGLLCVLDVRREQEDDSDLLLVLNTGEMVRSLSFAAESKDLLCTISTSEVLQLWSLSQQRLGVACGRLDLRSDSRLQVGESDGYVVDVLYDDSSGRASVLAGSVDGALVLYHLNLEGATFSQALPSGRVSSVGGHKAVVRASAQLGPTAFATGGEDGVICLWKPSDEEAGISSTPVGQSPAKKRRNSDAGGSHGS
ncbi:unnamed protein product [Polarella glacialis]|uniref:WD repeat-containing protein 89 n=1 Tax=Polarella glacialis TaxID=89957 RepID=A0A813IP52_POLGL|nr:unnamed protein product [Polarella glacialis]CAE8652550.1 unnamed protein product [Polarella glacialis]